MTIEEMIDYLRDHNHDDDITDATVAKLKAAEELAYYCNDHVHDLTGNLKDYLKDYEEAWK